MRGLDRLQGDGFWISGGVITNHQGESLPALGRREWSDDVHRYTPERLQKSSWHALHPRQYFTTSRCRVGQKNRCNRRWAVLVLPRYPPMEISWAMAKYMHFAGSTSCSMVPAPLFGSPSVGTGGRCRGRTHSHSTHREPLLRFCELSPAQDRLVELLRAPQASCPASPTCSSWLRSSPSVPWHGAVDRSASVIVSAAPTASLRQRYCRLVTLPNHHRHCPQLCDRHR